MGSWRGGRSLRKIESLQTRALLSSISLTQGTLEVQLTDGAAVNLTVNQGSLAVAINGIPSGSPINAAQITAISIVGDDGNNAIVLSNLPVSQLPNLTGVTVTAGAGDDTVLGSSANDSIDGGSGNDLLVGLSGADTLNGEAGQDTLAGSSGNDSLNGGAGNDSLAGQDGQNALVGGEGADTLAGISGADTQTSDASDIVVDGSSIPAPSQFAVVASTPSLPFIDAIDDIFTSYSSGVMTGMSLLTNDMGVSLTASVGSSTTSLGASISVNSDGHGPMTPRHLPR